MNKILKRVFIALIIGFTLLMCTQHYSPLFYYYTAVVYGGSLLMFIIGVIFLAGFRKLPHRKLLAIGIGLTIAFWLLPLHGIFLGVLQIVFYLPAAFTVIFTLISAAKTYKKRKQNKYWIAHLLVLIVLLLALLHQFFMTYSFFNTCFFGSCI